MYNSVVQLYLYQRGSTLRRENRSYGDFVEIQLFVGLLLPAFSGDMLLEIALGIHEANRHQGQSQIARLLADVSSEDAQSTSVYGQ